MEIGDALVYIADRIGMTVQQLLSLYFHGVRVEATLQLVFAVIFLLGVFLLVKKAVLDAGNVDEEKYPMRFVFLVLAIGAWGVLVSAVYQWVLAMLVPDYVAIQRILEALGSSCV